VVTCTPVSDGHHAGQDLYGVGFLALGGEARLAGPAAVEIVLMSSLVAATAAAAVDTQPIADPVALAEGRDRKYGRGVVRHRERFALESKSILTCRNARGWRDSPAMTAGGLNHTSARPRPEDIDRALLDGQVGGA